MSILHYIRSLHLLLLGLYHLIPSYTIVICMCSYCVRGIVIIQQFHLNKRYASSYYCSTAGGVRAVHVSTAKFIHQVYIPSYEMTTRILDSYPPYNENFFGLIKNIGARAATYIDLVSLFRLIASRMKRRGFTTNKYENTETKFLKVHSF